MLLALLCLVAAPGPLSPVADGAAQVRHLALLGRSEAPAPSPDGARLAFVTTLFGSPQIAVMPLDGGFPQQLTDEPGGIVGLHYSPVEPHLLVAVARRGEHLRLLFVDDQVAAVTEVDAAPGEQLFGGFSRDGKKLLYANLDGDRAALRMMTLDGRKVAEIAPPPNAAPTPNGATPPAANIPLAEATAGLASLGPISGDGRTALFQVRRQHDESIYLLDLATARADLITPHDKPARFRLPRYSPDGRTVYLLTDAGRATLGVDAVTVASKVRKAVLAGPREVQAYALSEDGHRLVAAQDADGETILSLLELPSLRPQPMPLPPGGALQLGPQGESPIVWTRAGDRLLFAWRLAADTTDLWTIRLGYGVPSRLTHSPHPGLPLDELARPQSVRLPADSPEFAQAWLWRPTQVERPRVAILLQERTRPVLERSALALAVSGIAVLGVSARADQAEAALAAALRYLASEAARADLDGRAPLLLVTSDTAIALEKPQRFAGVVSLGAEPPRVSSVPLLELHGKPDELPELARFAREQLKKP